MGQKTTFTGRDIGIDLGTANTLVYARGRGIMLNEPSVVAVDMLDGSVLSVGWEAKGLIGRTPSGIVAVRPLREGVIADFDVAERMLRHFIRKVTGGRRTGRLRVVVCVPSGTTSVERRAVIEAAVRAGARRVHLIEEPMAAAIGVGLPVGEATGSMVVDIGGGTTEVAVISMGGVVTARTVRTAGYAMDAAITAYVKRQYGLTIGERAAEDIKLNIGAAASTSAWAPAGMGALDGALDGGPEAGVRQGEPVPSLAVADGGGVGTAPGAPEPSTVESRTVRGWDHMSGLPKSLDLTSDEVRKALGEPVDTIVAAVRATLDQTPPELAGDIMDRGIVLTGGGALLHGLDERLGHELNIPVFLADDPLNAVVTGTGRCVEDFSAWHGMLDARPRPSLDPMT